MRDWFDHQPMTSYEAAMIAFSAEPQPRGHLIDEIVRLAHCSPATASAQLVSMVNDGAAERPSRGVYCLSRWLLADLDAQEE